VIDCRENCRSERLSRCVGTILVMGSLALVQGGGCAKHPGDAFLDPSNAGRWDHTPTVVPILERIASIEDQGGDSIEYSDVNADDLVPVAKAYRIVAGDQMEVTIYDLLSTDRPEVFTLAVDGRGTIDVPYVGRLVASGKTPEELKASIEAMVAPKVGNATVAVRVDQQRGQTFHIIGAVGQPGPYFIPKADYRVLEAITAGGNFDSNTEEVYVIRQVSLSEPEIPVLPGETPSVDGVKTEPKRNLEDLLNNLSRPTQGVDPSKPAGQPGAMRSLDGSTEHRREPVIRLQDGLAEPVKPSGTSGGPTGKPPVDLQDGGAGTAPARATTVPEFGRSSPQWIFVNGRWQQVQAKGTATKASTAPGGQPSGQAVDASMMTQRVIRVPLQPLMNGNQRYNIVIRPGDVLRVPAPPGGFFYVAGQISRPGAYTLTSVGRMTLRRAIENAGGLSNLGIPERVDLTRMVGRDRQATIMLNLRAIADGTQPDVFLKSNDLINVGTTWWAYPVAIIRGGLRVSYGFGLLADRNFGNDIFGVPPGSNNNN
jgi:polysaccharide biosynthesis/export protein